MGGSLRDGSSNADRLLAAATPRPWEAVCLRPSEAHLIQANRSVVPRSMPANVALIARAVNEYEALLECAAALARLCEFTADNGYAPPVDHSPSWSRAWAALADLAELRGAE